MINKVIAALLILSLSSAYAGEYKGSTLAPTIVVAAKIQAGHIPSQFKKFKRKDCPVCKGTGKYLSGDKINWSECGYCLPDPKETSYEEAAKQTVNTIAPAVVTPPPQKKVVQNPATRANETIIIQSPSTTVLPCPTCKPPTIIRKY